MQHIVHFNCLRHSGLANIYRVTRLRDESNASATCNALDCVHEPGICVREALRNDLDPFFVQIVFIN